MHTTVKVSWKTHLNIRNGCATGGGSKAAAGIVAVHSKGYLLPSVNVAIEKKTIDPSFDGHSPFKLIGAIAQTLKEIEPGKVICPSCSKQVEPKVFCSFCVQKLS